MQSDILEYYKAKFTKANYLRRGFSFLQGIIIESICLQTFYSLLSLSDDDNKKGNIKLSEKQFSAKRRHSEPHRHSKISDNQLGERTQIVLQE